MLKLLEGIRGIVMFFFYLIASRSALLSIKGLYPKGTAGVFIPSGVNVTTLLHRPYIHTYIISHNTTFY
jgi:hypothetical protein